MRDGPCRKICAYLVGIRFHDELGLGVKFCCVEREIVTSFTYKDHGALEIEL